MSGFHRVGIILSVLIVLNVFAIANPTLANGMAIAPTVGGYAS